MYYKKITHFIKESVERDGIIVTLRWIKGLRTASKAYAFEAVLVSKHTEDA